MAKKLSMWRRLDYKFLSAGTLTLLIMIVSAYPIAMLILSAFRVGGKFSMQNYIQILRDPDNFLAFRNTMFVSFVVVTLSTIIGVSLAWLVERTDTPWRQKLETTLIFPYLIPPFIAAFAWRELLGPVGYFNKLYMHLFGSREAAFSIYGQHGIIIVLTLLTYPIMYIISVRALKVMNPELEEAAELCGASTLTVTLSVTLPLIMPSITGAIVLIFAICISNFGVPAVLGLPANYPMLTTTIYTTILNYTRANNLSLASALSLSLVIMGLGVLFLQRSTLGKKSFAVGGHRIVPRITPLGKWRGIALFLCISVIFLTTLAPIGALFLDALTKAYGLPLALPNLTLKNFHSLLTMRLTQTALRNSVMLSIAAASLTTFIGFAVAYLKIRRRFKFGNVLDFIGTAPHSIPGTIIALAMILAWIKPVPILKICIYNTLWIILISYITRYLAYSLRTSTSALEQLDSSFEEAAQLSGASELQVVKDITFPLLKSSLFGGWLLIAVPALNELTVSILLYSSGRETVGVAAFLLIQEGAVASAAALGLVMIAVVFAGSVFLNKISGGRVRLL